MDSTLALQTRICTPRADYGRTYLKRAATNGGRGNQIGCVIIGLHPANVSRPKAQPTAVMEMHSLRSLAVFLFLLSMPAAAVQKVGRQENRSPLLIISSEW